MGNMCTCTADDLCLSLRLGNGLWFQHGLGLRILKFRVNNCVEGLVVLLWDLDSFSAQPGELQGELPQEILGALGAQFFGT